jgi:hypothetical protein
MKPRPQGGASFFLNPPAARLRQNAATLRTNLSTSMKHFAFLFLAACSVAATATAQVNLSGANPSYSQDFNTLDTGATNSSNLPMGWLIQETGAGVSANEQYRSGNGSANSGDTYSFGTIQATDRALGGLGSNGVQTRFGAAFTNNTGSPITSMSMSVRVEQWRAGDTSSRPDSVLFYYSTTATALDSTETAYTEVPTLMLNSVQTSATTNNGNALDGNTVNTIKTGTVQFPNPIPAGATFYIKWVDKNIVGNDDGLAIDDLTIAFTTGSGGGTGIASVATGIVPVSVLGRASADRILVGFTAAKAENFTLALFDLNGREVVRQTVQASAGANQTTLQPSGIAAGQYILSISSASSVGSAKVVVE